MLSSHWSFKILNKQGLLPDGRIMGNSGFSLCAFLYFPNVLLRKSSGSVIGGRWAGLKRGREAGMPPLTGALPQKGHPGGGADVLTRR